MPALVWNGEDSSATACGGQCLVTSLLLSLRRQELGAGMPILRGQCDTLPSKKGSNPVGIVQYIGQCTKDFQAKINTIPAEQTELSFVRKAWKISVDAT